MTETMQLQGEGVGGLDIPNVSLAVARAIEPWKLLDPELRTRSADLARAMADRFSVRMRDFSVVRLLQPELEPQSHVLYTADMGLFEGSWDQIFDPKADDRFIIQAGDEDIDTRMAMTEVLYDAFSGFRIARGRHPLPDSADLNKWSWTWLTGEVGKEDRIDAPTIYIERGVITVGAARRNLPDKFICFRPGAQI